MMKNNQNSKEKPKNVHAGHRERLRNRFLKEGLDNFTEHQVLELLLFYCIKQHDTNEMAHRFLLEYGSLSNLFESSAQEIKNRLNVTDNVAALLAMISQMSKKYLLSKWNDKTIFADSKSAGEYCVTLYKGIKYETFFVLSLDTNKRLLSSNMVSEGSITEAHVYPRKVVETAINFRASSVILVHNHPSGALSPSFSDIETTKRISEVLNAIGISTLDHIIVCGEKYFSFRQDGLMDDI